MVWFGCYLLPSEKVGDCDLLAPDVTGQDGGLPICLVEEVVGVYKEAARPLQAHWAHRRYSAQGKLAF